MVGAPLISMKDLLVESKIEDVEVVMKFVESELQSLGCSDDAWMQIKLAIDEIFGNICYYAYGSDSGPVKVSVGMSEDNKSVLLTFSDSGIPYDPLEADIPDVELDGDERPIGGLGIFLVRELMDDITYEYKDGNNILCLIKTI